MYALNLNFKRFEGKTCGNAFALSGCHYSDFRDNNILEVLNRF